MEKNETKKTSRTWLDDNMLRAFIQLHEQCDELRHYTYVRTNYQFMIEIDMPTCTALFFINRYGTDLVRGMDEKLLSKYMPNWQKLMQFTDWLRYPAVDFSTEDDHIDIETVEDWDDYVQFVFRNNLYDYDDLCYYIERHSELHYLKKIKDEPKYEVERMH